LQRFVQVVDERKAGSWPGRIEVGREERSLSFVPHEALAGAGA